LKRDAIVVTILIVVLLSSMFAVAYSYFFGKEATLETLPEGFFLGVTSGGNSTEIKTLIDKVKGYTNLIAFTNLEVTKNKTQLEEVSDYAFAAGLNFLVYMVYPSPRANFTYNPIEWTSEAKSKYGDRFLGYYLWDEPGGNQLDQGNFRQFSPNYDMPCDYRDAANTYVYYLYLQMREFVKTAKLFTSEYAVYWYDYEAGYDVVLCQFGWNHSRPINIALCRGAAEMHNKTWGAIVTWTYDQPPYIDSAPSLYQDMITAYNAGAKYVLVFNYPQIGQFGMLSEDHFEAIKNFKNYVLENPQNKSSNTDRIACLLPDNYGFGFRKPQDTIWGVFNADENSQYIWDKVNYLVRIYGDCFDIVYNSPWTRLFGKYHYDKLIAWNATGL